MSAAHPQQEDPNKPYWILRLVTEHNEGDFFEIKKDTERADEIQAMKQAWEMTEPGRAVKASQARLHYLSRFIKKIPDTESATVSESQTKATEEGPYSRSPTILDMSPRLIRKELECVDLTQYVRKTRAEPLLQTEELNQQRAMQKAEEVHRFRQYRTRVLSIRNIDQEERFKLKDEVLEMSWEMRDSLDEARQKIFSIREEYRNKLLEAERLRLEAQAGEEAALRAEREKKIPAPDTQKKKKGKKNLLSSTSFYPPPKYFKVNPYFLTALLSPLSVVLLTIDRSHAYVYISRERKPFGSVLSECFICRRRSVPGNAGEWKPSTQGFYINMFALPSLFSLQKMKTQSNTRQKQELINSRTND
ncbi:hypothetical protein MC885_020355 [Smutsia gigantea]|nr:hypothetical protein MC885_020355 [Smutsia gigantea]